MAECVTFAGILLTQNQNHQHSINKQTDFDDSHVVTGMVWGMVWYMNMHT